MKRRPKKLINSIKALFDGKWITEKEYLAIPDDQYEKVVRQRKRIIKQCTQ